jgi:tetratricopeptide (TPR) repeat protein
MCVFPILVKRTSVRLPLLFSAFLLLFLLLIQSCAAKPPSQDALKQYMQAEDFYVRGQVEAAAAVFSRVARDNPGFHQAAFMHAKSLYLLNRSDEAEKTLADLVARTPRYNEARIWLARIWIQQNRTDQAEKMLADLLGYDSQDARLLYLMAQVKSDQGELQDAIVYLQKAAATEEEMARVHIDLGRMYYRFGFDDKAGAELSRALLLLPSDSALARPVQELLARVNGRK